jgi:twitching motility protein PilU
MEIASHLGAMVEKNASDLYLTAGSPPVYRVEGVMQRIGKDVFTPGDLEKMAREIMNENQWQEFSRTNEMDLALVHDRVSRFRVNVLRQRGSIALVVRTIKCEIATIDELGLPPVLKELSVRKRGLVLVAGATGTGKSTTLAALIDYRNTSGPGHIVTVEDPIEFVHPHKQCLVTQRELGFDTASFGEALKRAVRQAPDVVMIGEVRDSESMEAAIMFADTGHLCLATLHSANACQTFERILNFFPETRHPQILMQLSLNLRGIISQRLVPTVDSTRVAALEILMATPRIKDLIKEGKTGELLEAMDQGIHEGCQTFEQSLFMLYKQGKITDEQAVANSDSPNNLRLKIKLDRAAPDEANGLRIKREITPVLGSVIDNSQRPDAPAPSKKKAVAGL